MAYLSLYRKWRPQTFDDVVGQQHVVRTLVNALNKRRTAHAYLFCGPRGTGKTTVARLLAKGLNCEQGPTGQVCDTCDQCRRIAEGNALDVIEIDGASNRGIDEVREIRERVHYAPTQGVYKVYIVDEVHMLTNEAFNALLKILEEPPAHVVFVFATTEAHKIPPTIVSRCQRFDFHRFRPNELIDQLRKVLKGENVPFEEEALGLVARHAEGGMRDALAVLDQCIAYRPEGVTVDVVNEVLGTAPRERLVEFVNAHIDGTMGDILVLIRELDEASTDLRQFARDVIGYLRDLMVLKASGSAADRLVTLLEAEKSQALEIANKLRLSQIVRAVELMGEVENAMRWAPSPTLALELACVELYEHIHNPAPSSDVGAQSVTPAKPVETQPTTQSRQSALRPDASKTDRPVSPAPTAPTAPPAHQSRPTREIAPARSSDKALGGQQPHVKQAAPSSGGDVQAAWDQLLQALRDEKLRQIEALLREGDPVRLTKNELIVVFPTNREFHHSSMSQPENRGQAERVLSRILGRAMTITLHIGDVPPDQAGTEHVPSEDGTQSQQGQEAESLDVPEDPTLQAALRVFGGKVTEVRSEEDDPR